MSIEAGLFTDYRVNIGSKLMKELGVTQEDSKSIQLSLHIVTNIVQHVRSWKHSYRRIV